MQKLLTRLFVTLVALGAFAASAQAAFIVDLATGDTGTSNGAIYNWVDQQTTGTGVIDPFLRVHASGIEEGYNTSEGTPLDDLGGIFTHNLQKSDLTVVTIGGTQYYEFLLDINQTSPNSELSLNNVSIYSSSTVIDPPEDDSLAGLNALFNMDVGAQGDTTVELDYNRNPGSGAGDMLMYVPVNLFAGVADSDYIYFYTLFDTPNDPNDGFEEWALRVGETPTVPDGGATAGLLGMAMLGLGLMARRKNVNQN